MVSIVQGMNIETALFICSAVIAASTLLGGLGATFYISYFSTAFIFAGIVFFAWKVYLQNDGGKTIGMCCSVTH